MPCVYVMAGNFLMFQIIVFVDPPFLLQCYSNDAMICRHGSLTFIRHNELQDLTASWLQDVCHDEAVEPPLATTSW